MDTIFQQTLTIDTRGRNTRKLKALLNVDSISLKTQHRSKLQPTLCTRFFINLTGTASGIDDFTENLYAEIPLYRK